MFDVTVAGDRCEVQSDYISSGNERELACKLILILQELFRFRIIYKDFPSSESECDRSIDLYTTNYGPVGCSTEDIVPLLAIYSHSYGFVLLQPAERALRSFYSEPFRRGVWLSMFATLLVTAVLLRAAHSLENKIGRRTESDLDHENSLQYEFLITLAAVCQMSVPTCTRMTSRRVLYGVFFFCCLLLHSFYTSKVVSALLSQEGSQVTIRMLADGDLHCLAHTHNDILDIEMDSEMEDLKRKKMRERRAVELETGLAQVKSRTAALFVEYDEVKEFIKKNFTENELCSIVEVDVLPNIPSFIWARKEFRYNEEFKRALLLMKERGIIRRSNSALPAHPSTCGPGLVAPARVEHLATALLILAVFYSTSLLILAAEVLHERIQKPRLFKFTN